MQKKKKQKRIAIYVDGSNLYYKLRDLELPNITYFRYGNFAEWLARGNKITAKRYYVGVVRAKENDKKGQKLRKNQRRLFNHLSSPKEGFVVKRGVIMKNDGVYHEKGVDVKIAVDLLVGAYEDFYDTAIVISSDTDLVPAIEKVKSLGKEVEYIGFAHRPSFGVQKYATITRLLVREELEPFITERMKK